MSYLAFSFDITTQTSGNDIITEPIMKRSFLSGVTPFIGNQWKIMSRKFCEFVSDSPEVERFKEFYKHTFIADEGFFQTVIMNTSYKPTIVNDDKRTIDWIPMGTIKLRPRDFTIQDANFLIASQDLFARKFDETVDSDIYEPARGKFITAARYTSYTNTQPGGLCLHS